MGQLSDDEFFAQLDEARRRKAQAGLKTQERDQQAVAAMAPGLAVGTAAGDALAAQADSPLRIAGQLGSGLNGGMAAAGGLTTDAANGMMSVNPMKSALESDTAHGLYDAALGQDNPVTKFFTPDPAEGAPLADNPVMGSRWIHDQMPTPQIPRTATERIADSVGTQVGASIIPTMGLSGAAALGIAPTAILDALAASSPQRMATAEAMLGAQAGLGGGLAKEVAPDSYTADLVGQMVGAFGPSAAYDIARGTGNWMRGLSGRVSEAEMKNHIGDLIARSTTKMTPDGPVNLLNGGIDEARVIEDQLPGYKLSLGQATGTPDILATEQAHIRMPGSFQNDWLAQRKGNQQAVEDFFDSHIMPRDDVSLANTQDAMRKVIDDRVNQITSDAAPSMGPKASSTALRDQVEEGLASWKAYSNKLYDGIPSDMEAPYKPVLDEVVNQIHNQPEFSNPKAIPSIAKRIYSQVIKPVADSLPAGKGQASLIASATDGATTTLGSLRNLKTQILEEVRSGYNDIAKGNSSSQAAKSIPNNQRLLNSADDAIDAIGSNPDNPPGVVNDLRVAGALYKDGASRFKRKAMAQALGSDQYGGSRVPGAQFFDQFFEPGSTSVAAEQLKAASVLVDPATGEFVPNPAVEPLVRDSVLNAIARDATDVDGKLSAAKLAAWRSPKKYGAFLKEYPALDKELSTLQSAQDALEGMATSPAKSLANVQKSALGLALDADPEVAVAKVLNGANPIGNLRRLRKIVEPFPDAWPGLQREVIDYAKKQTGSTQRGVWDTYDFLHPNKLNDFITDHRPKLEEIYDPEQMANVRVAGRAADLAARADKAAMAGSPTGQILSNMSTKYVPTTPMKSFLKMSWNLLRLPIKGALAWTHPLPFIAGEAGARMLNKHFANMTEEKLRTLWDEALLNKDVAKAWADHARGASPALTAQRLHAHLAGMGVGYEDERNKQNAKPNLTLDEIDNVPRDTVQPLPKPPPPPPPPPKPVKPPKPVDVTKDLKRGKVGPSDLADVARMSGGA